MAKNALAEKKESMPSVIDEMLEQDAGHGFENVGQADKVIPFVQIAQALSPQINDAEANYIPGLKQGDAFNTANNRVWPGKTGFLFVPAAYRLQHNEWVPREKGGGFVAEHGPEIMAKVTAEDRGGKFGRWLPNGNTIVVAGVWYGLIVNNQGTELPSPAVIAFTSTQLKKSKKLMSVLDDRRVSHNGKMIKPPLFLNVVEMTTVPEQNDKGKWHGWRPQLLNDDVRSLPNADQVYAMAKEFQKAVVENQVRAAPVDADDQSASKGGDTM